MMHDRGDDDALPITQDLLAEMLGVQRSTITNAARELERAGSIEPGRRQVTLLDRKGLTAAFGECYQLVRARLAFHIPIRVGNALAAPSVIYITDSMDKTSGESEERGLILSSEDCAGTSMRDVDPIDLVETIREGLLVLESDLTVRFANRSFCNTFAVAREETVGRKLYELGNGQWDIPELRRLIQSIVPAHASVEAFEVDQVFPSIGRRVMLLNARKVYRPGNNVEQILLAIEDVTERMRLEHEHALAHRRIKMLLQELTHRVKNSLQTIASIVRIEAGHHKSDEGRGALEQVSNRISAIGRLYANLEKADTIGAIDASLYLKEVCANLIASVQQGGRAISLTTDIASELLPTERTIPIGLIVNELVMNAIKYAFPDGRGGAVIVALKREPGQLRLTVADNGSGADFQRADSGLGGRLVEGFAKQLGGRIERKSGSQGTTVHLILPSSEGGSAMEE